MLCNHITHTQSPVNNRLLVSSQEKPNTSPNSFAYEIPCWSPKHWPGDCVLSHQLLSVCGGQHSMLPARSHTYTTTFSPPLFSGSTFTTWLCFFTQTHSGQSELANMMGKQNPVATEQNPFHCSTVTLTDKELTEPPPPYPKATEPEFALLISYCVLSIDAAILLSHSFHWHSLLRLSI